MRSKKKLYNTLKLIKKPEISTKRLSCYPNRVKAVTDNVPTKRHKDWSVPSL